MDDFYLMYGAELGFTLMAIDSDDAVFRSRRFISGILDLTICVIHIFLCHS